MQALLKESLELTNHYFCVADKLFEAWNNRLTLPLTKLPERYLRGHLTIHLHGFLHPGERRCGFCFVVFYDRLHCFRSVALNDPWKEEENLPVFIKSVHIMDNQERISKGIGSHVWLQSLDDCLGVNRHSLYLSLVSSDFVFTSGTPIKDGKLNSVWMGYPVVGTRKLPSDVIEAGPQMMHDLSSQYAKPQRNWTGKVIVHGFLNHLTIFINEDWVLAMIKEGQ